MFIDTHVHLNDLKLYEKLEEVLNESKENKVNKWVVVSYDLASSKRALEIAEKIENCYCAIGFHPTDIRGYDEEYTWLEENINHPKVVALGEIGFDFYHDRTTKEEQYEAFVKQIRIAKKYNKPVVIHSRDALEITYKVLKEEHIEEVGGVMHSYSGSSEFAPNFIKLNMLLGISGPVTFKNGIKMKEVVRDIPLEYLLSETDSPYLTPHPYRGKENGPKYIPLIVEEISKIKEIEINHCAEVLMNNAKKLFHL